MSTSNPLLPERSFAELAAHILLELQGSVITPMTEYLVYGIEDSNSRHSVKSILDITRADNDMKADIYKLIIALEPHEDLVRALIEKLYRQSNRGPSAAA